jgi:hypothetical protein
MATGGQPYRGYTQRRHSLPSRLHQRRIKATTDNTKEITTTTEKVNEKENKLQRRINIQTTQKLQLNTINIMYVGTMDRIQKQLNEFN